MVPELSLSRLRILALISIFPFLAGCAPVALTVLGVGTAVGANYTLNGYAYKTFSAPVNEVNRAARVALDRMGIGIEDDVRNDKGHTITALASEWKIEITLEPISNKTTRMRSHVSRNTLQKDRATAIEIIIQTENVMLGTKA
jgi:hypothetical protein